MKMLHIRQLSDFGPIAHIDDPIVLNDLTVFMGDNSVGKSYLAMLTSAIFGMTQAYQDTDMLQRLHEFFHDDPLIQDLASFASQMIRLEPNDTIKFTLEDTRIESLKHIVKYAVDDLTQHYLMEKIFDNNVSIGKIDIDIGEFSANPLRNFEIECTYREDMKTITIDMGKIRTKYRTNDKNTDTFISKTRETLLGTLLYSTMKSHVFLGSVYLPASRTGYLQTYPILAEKAIESAYSTGGEPTKKLPLFITAFITMLNTSTFISNKNEALVREIEESILQGKVNLSPENSEITFVLSSGQKMEVNFLSSTISELIPLVTFLKRGFINDETLCVIEEPEAHLSFENQRRIARIIVRMIQEGIKVLITTHSDFLIYELNNLMIAHSLIPYRNHDEVDAALGAYPITLDSQKISLYTFISNDQGRSIVRKTSLDSQGIESEYIFDRTYDVIKAKNSLLELVESYDA